MNLIMLMVRLFPLMVEYIADSIMLIICLSFIIISILVLGWFICNRLLRSSNWYKNYFIHTKQFQQANEKKILDVVNVGSNPAVFDFFYDDVNGVNWATGSQGPKMDFDILNRYSSQIKDGGVVLIPIVPFSSCSPYLAHYKPSFKGISSIARYIVAMGLSQKEIKKLKGNYKKAYSWLKYPLFFEPKAVRYLYRDVKEDTRNLITDQPMSFYDLNQDADHWINGWKSEFDISDLEAPLDKKMEMCHEECALQFVSIIDFCKEHNLRPILLHPPISRILNEKFSDKTKEIYIYSFVRRIQKKIDVEFRDYISDKDFLSPSLYFNSFFLNLRGRKLFTQRVLKDLGLK